MLSEEKKYFIKNTELIMINSETNAESCIIYFKVLHCKCRNERRVKVFN